MTMVNSGLKGLIKPVFIYMTVDVETGTCIQVERFTMENKKTYMYPCSILPVMHQPNNYCDVYLFILVVCT